MKSTIFKIFTVLFIIEAVLLFNSFSNMKYIEPMLILDENTSIYPIVENSDLVGDSYVRTLKVRYKDINKRVVKNDSTYYRCAFETQMTFYSAFDTLALNSLSRKSCEIIAFFNLDTTDINWVKNNHIYFIKFKNMNTKYEIVLENPEPRYLTNVFLKYNRK
jgi:hypothetical protein